MKTNNLRFLLFGGALAATLALGTRASAQVALTGPAYTQNFDTLISAGTNQPWTNNITLPGWSLFRQPAPPSQVAIPTINAGDGASNTGSFYSLGTTGSGERSFGGVASGGAYFGSPASNAVAGWITAGFTNQTGASIDSFTAGYDGEQWRNGGATAPLAQTMVMEYGFGSAFDTVPTWTPAGGAFNFTSPIFAVTAAALDGNLAANRTAGLGGTISSLSWANNDTLWLRWIEHNDIGNDHALSLDNFGLSYTNAQQNPVLSASGGSAGNVRIGTSGSLTASATNVGPGGPLTGTFPVASPEFGGGGSAFSLASGGSQNEIYSYTPVDHGADNQVLTVASNGGNQAITLDGTGVGPEFSDDDADDCIDVGNVFFGGPSSAAFTISNSTADGNLLALTDMTVTSVSVVDDDGFVLFSTDLLAGTVISAGGSQVVNIFGNYGGTPQQFSTGSLVIGTDVGAALGGDGADFTFELKGYAVPEPSTMLLTGCGALALLVAARRRRAA